MKFFLIAVLCLILVLFYPLKDIIVIILIFAIIELDLKERETKGKIKKLKEKIRKRQ